METDDRMDYDGETLLLPIIIPGQVYPNNRIHKFYPKHFGQLT